MEIRFNRTGTERKVLVAAVSEIVGCESKYMGAPGFAYSVGQYTIDKGGALIVSGQADPTMTETLLTDLALRGFVADTADKLAIEVPLDGFSADAHINLGKLILSKYKLIQKAIGTEVLPIIQKDDRLCFPWFDADSTSAHVAAYTQFIHALCEMAKNQKRVTAKEKPIESEKYAFRCFLLRLGFVGKEYAQARRILLYNLSGSGSYANKGAGDDEE